MTTTTTTIGTPNNYPQLSQAEVLNRLDAEISFITLASSLPNDPRTLIRAILRRRLDGSEIARAEATDKKLAERDIMAKATELLREVAVGVGNPLDVVAHASQINGDSEDFYHIGNPSYPEIITRIAEGKDEDGDAEKLAGHMRKLGITRDGANADVAAVRGRMAEEARIKRKEDELRGIPSFEKIAYSVARLDEEIDRVLAPLKAKRDELIELQQKRCDVEWDHAHATFTPTINQIDRLGPAVRVERGDPRVLCSDHAGDDPPQ